MKIIFNNGFRADLEVFGGKLYLLGPYKIGPGRQVRANINSFTLELGRPLRWTYEKDGKTVEEDSGDIVVSHFV